MQTPKSREKMMKLPSVPVVFGKLRAALQSARAFPVDSEQAENVPSYEIAKECRAYQHEVERLRAMAEEYAQNLKRRLI